MELFDRNFREILSSQAITVLGGVAAGAILALWTNKLLLIPGMLILLPGFLALRGSISGSLASRISSGLFLGVIKPKSMKTRIIRGNVIATFALAMAASLSLGLMAYLLSWVFFGTAKWEIVLIPLFAGIIANAIEIPIAIMATFTLFRRGHDPNNIMGPFVTMIGDITGILSIFVASVLIP